MHIPPRLSGGGASRTAIDLRSGNPNEINTVHLGDAVIAARGRTLRSVAFCYRYVVGYSGCEGPGPSFELQLVDEEDAVVAMPAWAVRECPHCRGGAGGASAGGGGGGDTCGECCTDESTAPTEPRVHVLYTSPEAGRTPSWDAATGGSPTNYCSPIRVQRGCRIGPLVGARQSLRIVFTNRRRNMHLTGEREACELAMRLSFEALADVT